MKDIIDTINGKMGKKQIDHSLIGSFTKLARESPNIR